MSGVHAHTVAYVRDTMLDQKEPPSTSVGAIGWARQNLFSGWFNTILTIIVLGLVAFVLGNILPWIFSPTWNAASLSECREILAAAGSVSDHGTSGACWGVINERWVQLLFGFYPSHLYWRPILALILLCVALAPILFASSVPAKLIYFSALYPFIFPWLLWGGTVWGPLAALAGVVLLGEALTLRTVIGAGLILSAMLLAEIYLRSLRTNPALRKRIKA